MKNITRLTALLPLLFGVPNTGLTQDIKTTTGDSVSSSLPADVVAAIQSAESTKLIFPVSNFEQFDGQILKADEVVFSPDARLLLTKAELPWVAIVAKKIKFADPNKWARIEFQPPVSKSTIPKTAASGSNGAHDTGNTNHQGNPGGDGGEGQKGTKGFTPSKPPHLYVVTNSIESAKGLPPSISLSIRVVGLNGGDGGTGGTGGDGGKGGAGGKGATSLFDCKSGGGPGGRGGTGGKGGEGGDGGDGGGGGDVTFVAPEQAINLLTYANVTNVGGFSGRPGSGGFPGHPGPGGEGAGQNGYCTNTPKGPSGFGGSSGQSGKMGQDGAKGVVEAITVKNVDVSFHQ